MNKSQTFCNAHQILRETQELSLDLLIWVTGSFALEFPGNRFLYKMIHCRQSVVYKKTPQTTSGEASFL